MEQELRQKLEKFFKNLLKITTRVLFYLLLPQIGSFYKITGTCFFLLFFFKQNKKIIFFFNYTKLITSNKLNGNNSILQ